jgi:hypothetical protein
VDDARRQLQRFWQTYQVKDIPNFRKEMMEVIGVVRGGKGDEKDLKELCLKHVRDQALAEYGELIERVFNQ